MTGHLTVQELEGFRNHTSAPQQLLRADRHLATCPECQRRLRAVGIAQPLPSLVVESDAPLHATNEQICSYIDGAQDAPEREWMEYHLQACTQCAAEAKDLQAFDARMVAENQPAVSPRNAQVRWKQRFQQTLAGFLAAPQRRGFAVVALSLLVIGVVALSHVQVAAPTPADSHTMLYRVTHGAPGDTEFLFGGILLAALGLAGIWYRFRK